VSYDIEDVLNNIKVILKANLNTEITNINTAKADSITLSSVNDNAYAFQSLDHEIYNYNPFVFFGVVDIATTANGPYTSEELTISVMLIATDDGQGETMTRKMLRYNQALKETFKNNWAKGGIRNRIEIESMLPVKIEGLNDTQEHRVVGVELKTILS